MADLDPEKVALHLGEVLSRREGRTRAGLHGGAGQGRDGSRRRSPSAWAWGAACESATVWTCDFSYDYVKINADYRS